MTKDELKDGYLIKDRDGHYSLVTHTYYGDIIILSEDGGCTFLKTYRNDLSYIYWRGNDIMVVYGHINNTLNQTSNGVDIFDYRRRPVYWKRHEVKEMTMAEINEAVGCEVKIVESHEEE